MLVFKGLALALLQGQSVGPFPRNVPETVVGLHPGAASRHRYAASHLAAYRYRAGAGAAPCQRQEPRARTVARDRGRALWVLRGEERRAVRRGALLHLPDRLASRIAERPCHHDGADRAVRLRHEANGDWPTNLRRRRQRQGGETVRHQDRAAYFPHLRQHGRSGRSGRTGLRRAPQHGDAQGGHRLRARRHRRLLHRRRLRVWRRRPRRRGRCRCHDHGRDEQRHVDSWHRHRLSAGDQGSGLLGAVCIDVYNQRR